MINAADLLDTALWALSTQSMSAAIDVIERGLEKERERSAVLERALDKIDRHVVGACGDKGMPEPCEECVEMREIAEQALEAYRKGE